MNDLLLRGPSLDAVDGAHQILVGIGVTEAHVALTERTKAGAVEARHARVIQERIRNFFGTASGAFHVDESVERPSGNGASPAGDIVQTGAERIPPAPE